MSAWMAWLFGLMAAVLFLSGLNESLFLMLHHALAVVPAVIWRLLSMFGEPTFVIGLLLMLVARKPGRLLRIFATALAGMLASIGLKALFDVARPPLVLPTGSVTLLDVLPGNGAFPSGHAIAVALLVGVLLAGRRGALQTGLLLLAILVSLSRVAIGVHWPLDVLAGMAVGFAISAATMKLPLLLWPPALLQQCLRLLLLILGAVSMWKLMRVPPNESYVLFNVLTLAACIWCWKQKQNGA